MNPPVPYGDKLVAADVLDDGSFGTSTAISSSGLVLAVGATLWRATEGSTDFIGGVYIYDWNGSAWIQRGGVLTASDAADGDRFGTGVALSDDGTVLVVGAARWETLATDAGGVYTYDWSGSAWVQRGAILSTSPSVGLYFGSAVSLSGNGAALVVGLLYPIGGGNLRGRILTYDWSGSAWVQRGVSLAAADEEANDFFGYNAALSADGSVLAVGASLWEGDVVDQGGVYIYDRSGSTWIQRGAVLTASDAAFRDNFGNGVALSDAGTMLAVGATGRDDPATSAGGVYILDWDGSAWVQRGTVIVPDTTADILRTAFGRGVALSGDGGVLVGGAGEADLTYQGAVFTYTFMSQVFWTNLFGQREA